MNKLHVDARRHAERDKRNDFVERVVISIFPAFIHRAGTEKQRTEACIEAIDWAYELWDCLDRRKRE